ncbi:hypothetical protein EJ07DRAFT_156971 [Lizonia empirigonia]|nr:hypothetical protein EJ07DRAFT_156971 [Lizonia empirigonia]
MHSSLDLPDLPRPPKKRPSALAYTSNTLPRPDIHRSGHPQIGLWGRHHDTSWLLEHVTSPESRASVHVPSYTKVVAHRNYEASNISCIQGSAAETPPTTRRIEAPSFRATPALPNVKVTRDVLAIWVMTRPPQVCHVVPFTPVVHALQPCSLLGFVNMLRKLDIDARLIANMATSTFICAVTFSCKETECVI